MGRIVKEYDVRRKELIDISESLFSKKGFEDTTVEDIIKKARVAKGTFYHYFKSKDEILKAVIDRYMDEIIGLMEKTLANDKLNAIQKILFLFQISSEYRKTHKGSERLVDYIHEERNEIIHHRLEVQNTPIFEDFFERIVREGIDEGVFKTEYPKEAAMAIVATMNAIGHSARRAHDMTDEEKIQAFIAFLDLLERILGTKKDAFNEILKLIEVNK
jgi:AcrR family transcriptional regulator